MAPKRTHVDLTAEQHERLGELAERHDRSMSELIHEAIDLFLREVAPESHEDAAQEGQGAEEPDPGSEPGRRAT